MPTSNHPGRPEPLFAALEVDAFPSQVLAVWNRSLEGAPFVVVQQNPESRKTMVLSCSPAARAGGIFPGMPLFLARRRLRGLGLCDGAEAGVEMRNLDWERNACEELGRLFYAYTPVFTLRDTGKAVLDLSGTPAARRFARAPAGLAQSLREEIRRKIGFQHIAIGLSDSKPAAQVMAKLAQPGGTRLCEPGAGMRLLDPLAPELLPGLSPACHARLRRYAIASIGQLRMLGREGLTSHFGSEGERLYSLLCGLDLEAAPAQKGQSGPGEPGGPFGPGVNGNGAITAETFLDRDVNDERILAQQVRLTADKLAFHMRKEGAVTDKCTLILKYADSKTVRKTFSLGKATGAFLPLAEKAKTVFFALYRRRVALKSLSLAVNLPKRDTGQLDLFDSHWDMKQKDIGEAVAKIRGRLCFGAILAASNVERT